jgi:hypothetical protein
MREESRAPKVAGFERQRQVPSPADDDWHARIDLWSDQQVAEIERLSNGSGCLTTRHDETANAVVHELASDCGEQGV